MSKGDYILLNRSLMLNDLWKDEPFTRGQAWVDLLMLANWKDGVATVKGEPVPYKRGQLCRAMKQLSLRWHWSEGKVKRYLELLTEMEQISFRNHTKSGAQNGAQKRAVTTVITITNYDVYQSDGAHNEVETERGRSVDEACSERARRGGKEGKKEKQHKGGFVLPDWIPQDAWDGWLEMRRKKKTPTTDRALELAVDKLRKLLDEGEDPGAVLDQSTGKGWTDVYPLKQRDAPRASAPRKNNNAAAAEFLEKLKKEGLYEDYEREEG